MIPNKRSVREVIESQNLAIIGASRNPWKPGAMLIDILKKTGFKGKIAGVNPQGGEVYDVPLYPSLADVPFPVDLAVLLIPPQNVPAAVAECSRLGLRGVVISSEGFAETGAEGQTYQNQVREILRSSGMRGFGPNTLGLVNTTSGLTTSYYVDEKMLRPGSIGFAAQSGIFVGALLRYLSSFDGLGLSKGLGLGNKVDVDESDALAFLGEDEQTKIIGMYIEDVRDGHRFLETARQAVERKPVLIVKGGRTAAGGHAIASHTASLAGNDAVFDGALRQAGVLRMNSIEELMGTLMGFSWMPRPTGRNLAFVTFSGAQAIMSLDAATELGLKLAEFSQTTREKIGQVIATSSKAHNPIDFFPDMMVHGFEKTSTHLVRALLDDEQVHGIIFISFALMGSEPYRPLVELIKEKPAKPVFVSLLGNKADLRDTSEYLLANQVPFYAFPEMAVRVFSHMSRYQTISTKR